MFHGFMPRERNNAISPYWHTIAISLRISILTSVVVLGSIDNFDEYSLIISLPQLPHEFITTVKL